MNKNEITLMIKTLQSLTVSGKDNLSKVLGLIQFLETKLNQPQTKPDVNE